MSRIDSERQASDEIEITDEMVAAGFTEFCQFDSRYEDDCDMLRRVYAAMAARSPHLVQAVSD